MDALAWHLASIANLVVWLGLGFGKGWRTLTLIFWLEAVSLLTTAWVYLALPFPWPPLWYAEDAFVIFTQLLMAVAVALTHKRGTARWLPPLYALYVALGLAYGHGQSDALPVSQWTLYYARLWEGIGTEFLLGWCVWSGKLGHMSDIDPILPPAEPDSIPHEINEPEPELGPPGNPPPPQ